jgi:hypothetical protein
MGVPTFDYGNNLRQMAKEAGITRAFDFPGFVPAYIRPLFCRGVGPFRWASLTGDPEDIFKTDAKVKELMPNDKHLHRWLDMARERIHFQGLPARICWVGLGDRHRLGLAFNEMVASGELKAPIVIGRDHLDSGSVASPNRETESMKDGSDAVSDWPLLNALLNCASGATWVSLHHGGGVGMDVVEVGTGALAGFRLCTSAEHAQKKKNCKGNPLCVFGWRQFGGIWKVPYPFDSKLGQNPRALCRVDVAGSSAGGASASASSSASLQQQPLKKCGLKNLGATCYLNVFIQMLFNNLLVRDAVNNIVVDGDTGHMGKSSEAVDDGAGSKIVEALQITFGHLEKSTKAVYDLKHFVTLLQLDTGEQQDPQEFSKLFFTFLEKFNWPLKNTTLAPVGRLICGKERYSTECSHCQNKSGQATEFTEIGLNIEGCSSIDAALRSYFQEVGWPGNCKRLLHIVPRVLLTIIRASHHGLTRRSWRARTSTSVPDAMKRETRRGGWKLSRNQQCCFSS